MRIIARVRPKVLAINGGDGTVQATLTELYNGGHFEGDPPPVAVLPSGKTNLIALDLGARGDAIATLERLIELARSDELARYTVPRELLALRRPGAEDRPVIGMFLGGAGLADTMLYCRHKIYPLGLPNSISHGLTFLAYVARLALKLKASFLPPPATRTDLDMPTRDRISGQFAFLAVTTLNKMLLSNTIGGEGRGPLKVSRSRSRPALCFACSLPGSPAGTRARRCAASTSRKWTKLQSTAKARTHSRRRDVQGRAGQPDPPHARAAAVVRQAGGLSTSSMSALRELVAAELELPVDPRVSAVAKAIAAKHGDAAHARCCSTGRASGRSSSTV